MADFESQLDSAQFMRVHRSYIINLSLISQLHREARNTLVKLVDADRTIPVARAKVTALNEHLRLKHKH
jgi:DNA-binding LytR/AlgR family response regulator